MDQHFLPVVLFPIKQRALKLQQRRRLPDVDPAQQHLLQEKPRNLDLLDDRIYRDPAFGRGRAIGQEREHARGSVQHDAIEDDQPQHVPCPLGLRHEVQPRVQDNGLSGDHHAPARPNNHSIHDIVAFHALVDVVEFQEHAHSVQEDAPCCDKQRVVVEAGIAFEEGLDENGELCDVVPRYG